jgi:hypothetical protein
MTRDALDAYLSTVQYKPPHIVFDEEKYQRDIEAGLITRSRSVNNSPYFPSELKAAHGASTLNIPPNTGKKRVVIATTIAYNWPAAYIVTCFDAFCKTYDLWQLDPSGNPILVGGNKIRPTIEVINLAPYPGGGHGNPPLSTTPNVNQPVIDIINNTIIGSGFLLNGPITDRSGLLSIPQFVEPTGTEAEVSNKIAWLSELILNFWAIAMNPNAHFRVVNGASPMGNDIENAVVYASTDSNFASNPYGTTDYINMSWGDSNPGLDRPLNDDLHIFLNPRICYFAAAGNTRWAGYPATSSNVMCVGGVGLFYNTLAAISGTTNPVVQVWSDGDPTMPNGYGGGGTGFSHGDPSLGSFTGNYPRPAHQPTTLDGVANFNNGIRVCPDICSVADPVTGLLIIFPNSAGTLIKKIVSGGTSLASPLMCGLFSHLSQRRINEELPPFTTRINNTSNNLQKLLYDNFKQNGTFTQSSPLFYDIRSGSTVLPTITELGPNNNGRTFSAGPGYDITTGLGFANMQNIQTAIFQTSQPIATPPIDSGSGSNNGNTGGGGGTFQIVGTPSVAQRPQGNTRNQVRIIIN